MCGQLGVLSPFTVLALIRAINSGLMVSDLNLQCCNFRCVILFVVQNGLSVFYSTEKMKTKVNGWGWNLIGINPASSVSKGFHWAFWTVRDWLCQLPSRRFLGHQRSVLPQK